MSKWFESNSIVFRIFKWSVAFLLLTTSLAKFVSSGTNASAHWADPVFGVPFREVLWMAGLAELAGAVICVASRSVSLTMGTTAWLATNLVLYRLGLWWVGSQKPCGCLGGLTDALHLSLEATNVILKIVLAYILVGSYSILIAHYWQKLKITSPVLPDKMPEVAG
jgi:hypothetical protein